MSECVCVCVFCCFLGWGRGGVLVLGFVIFGLGFRIQVL